jgi:hypothetical protein
MHEAGDRVQRVVRFGELAPHGPAVPHVGDDMQFDRATGRGQSARHPRRIVAPDVVCREQQCPTRQIGRVAILRRWSTFPRRGSITSREAAMNSVGRIRAA